MIGYSTDRDLGVDYGYPGLGIITGVLIGMITANIAGADSKTPVLGYTVPYAIANVFLTLPGPVIVLTV
jgi:hypothetical protein